MAHPNEELTLSGELWLNEAWLRGFGDDSDAMQRCFMAAREISRDSGATRRRCRFLEDEPQERSTSRGTAPLSFSALPRPDRDGLVMK